MSMSANRTAADSIIVILYYARVELMNLPVRFGAASYRVGVDRFHRGAAAQYYYYKLRRRRRPVKADCNQRTQAARHNNIVIL